MLSRLKSILKSLWGDDVGNVTLIFALAIIPVIGVIGLTVDYGRASAIRMRLQASLDAAVLDGARSASNPVEKAQVAFAANFAKADLTLSGPTFVSGSDGSLTGTVTAEVPTIFIRLLATKTIAVGATAVAKVSALEAQVCLLLKSSNTSNPLVVNSGARLNAADCEVHVLYTGSPAAIFNAGSLFATKRTCLAGSSPLYNSTKVANVETRCRTANDPFADNLPVPPTTPCTARNGTYDGGAVSLSPGVYCGWFNFNNSPDVTLAPGLYVISGGGWNVNGGSWTGTDVTFYFADTSLIQFNSGISAALSAPTAGTYAGILMYEKAGLANTNFVFNDSVSNSLQGLIYLPSRNVTFNAKSKLSTDRATLVFNSLILDQTHWGLAPADSRTIVAPGSAGSVHLVK
jgi:Flp pilus assembly protein TadG